MTSRDFRPAVRTALMATAFAAVAASPAAGEYLYRHVMTGIAQAPAPKPPAQCALPWGGALESGGSVDAFQTGSVPYGATCASEVRFCDDGVLSGSFANQACAPEAPPSCPTRSVYWSVGTYTCSGTAPQRDSGWSVTVSSPSSHDIRGSASFVCNNGTWKQVGSSTCRMHY